MSKGHNYDTAFYGGLSPEQLRTVVERLERLDSEKKNISEDIKEVFAEAKGTGFDVKTIRQILKLRKIETNEREEQEYLLGTYCRALGMLPTEDGEEVEIEPVTIEPIAKIRLLAHINLLEAAELADLVRKDAEFVESIRDLQKQFGNNTLITEPQLKWLEDLAGRE